MNSTFLKIRIDSLQVNYTNEGKMACAGSATFKYPGRDNSEPQGHINISAYGNSAVNIAEAGIKGVILARGAIQFEVVERENYKEQVATFNIYQSDVIRPNKATPTPGFPPALPSSPVPLTPSIVLPKPTLSQPVATAQSNGSVAQYEDIPF